MPLGEVGPLERKVEIEALPLKRRYFTAIGLSSVKMLLVITSTSDELLKSFNIDDFE